MTRTAIPVVPWASAPGFGQPMCPGGLADVPQWRGAVSYTARVRRVVLRGPAWQRALPAAAVRGPVPEQAAADEWARRGPLGLVKRFPLAVNDDTAVVLASAPDPPRLPLFDLALGDGPLWTITERQAMLTRPRLTRPREERCAAVLPAWASSSLHDLGAPSLGFGEAARALIALLRPGDYWGRATQAAMARYSRTGFESAAVTGLRVQAAAMVKRRPGVLREAVLRFGHPYAVLGVCRGGRWDGLPVFPAWVMSPSPAG